MRILTEASGSMTSGYLQKKIKEAGHISIGSDITPLNCAHCLSDEFILVPPCNDPDLWEKMTALLKENAIEMVIPSLDETLLGWAERKEAFRKMGIEILLSDPEVIRLFQDKWLTYETFVKYGMPTPETALDDRFPLIKPRQGRGSQGIVINEMVETMAGRVSQELLKGDEYTVDCFYDRDHQPVYIIPRRRIDIKEGKSTKGEVVRLPGVESLIREFSTKVRFTGPINYQCFISPEGGIKFIEINPRIAGGMALGMEASENWVSLMVGNLMHHRSITPVPVNYGLKMVRYYAECFIP